jgi:flagellar biosynthesis/type III secretory pathway protein FliH
MFEEEAEEAGNEKIKGNYQFARCARKSYKDGFKDGAEFGYNKAKEIIKDYMTIVNGAHTTLCGVPEENRTIHVLKLNEKAEEFLNSELIEKAEQFIKE